VYVCDRCGGPLVIDYSQRSCPICGHCFALLRLVGPRGWTIPLDLGSVPIGRDLLGGAATLSRVHGIFCRRGPETTLEAVGHNGIFRRSRSKWLRLPQGRPIVVSQGDRLRFADVEATVESI
jgi:hypothetical protein